MDKANAALADYLAARGTPLHLVAHRIDDDIAANSTVRAYRVRKTAGSLFLGQRRLDTIGKSVARKVVGRQSNALVVTNGINCHWQDINWVHYVHHAWPHRASTGPAWLRLKGAVEDRIALKQERALVRGARLVIANSERTRQDLMEKVGVDSEKIQVVRYGADEDWKNSSAARSREARTWLGINDHRPVVAFVGALGHDPRKGFDTLWAAWQRLCAQRDWTATLVVAGGGRAVESWKRIINRAGLGGRVIMLGFTTRVPDVLAASDLLVSPVRYEAYGLNVQEAICCGVPAIVSAAAGVAERYPPSLADMLLPDPEDADDLSARMLAWSRNIDAVRQRFEPLVRTLRMRTWEDMAGQITDLDVSQTQARTA